MVDEEALKRYYNDRYAQHGTSTMRPPHAYEIFLDHLEVQSGKRLLDVACGTGYLLKAANARGLATTGVDIAEEAVKVAKAVSPHSQLCVSSGEDMPFPDQTFDYLTCLGSLEHFIDQDRGLQEFKRVTTSDARLCIVVPNSEYWVWKLKGESGTEQQAVQERLLTYAQWKELLHRNGLRIAKVFRDNWPAKDRPVFASKNPLHILKRAAFQTLWRIMPFRYSYQFIIVADKS